MQPVFYQKTCDRDRRRERTIIFLFQKEHKTQSVSERSVNIVCDHAAEQTYEIVLVKMSFQLCAAVRIYIVSAARSLTCRDDLNSKWRLLLAENELSRVSLLSRISIGN